MQTDLSPLRILNSPLGGGIGDFIKASFTTCVSCALGPSSQSCHFYGDDKLLANNDSGLLVSTGEVVVLSNCDEGHW